MICHLQMDDSRLLSDRDDMPFFLITWLTFFSQSVFRGVATVCVAIRIHTTIL